MRCQSCAMALAAVTMLSIDLAMMSVNPPFAHPTTKNPGTWPAVRSPGLLFGARTRLWTLVGMILAGREGGTKLLQTL